MKKKNFPLYQVTSEFADCLEKAFSPAGKSGAGAASEAPDSQPGKKPGVMSITPLSSSQLGQISEDTAHLSVWVDWGMEENTLFARLERSQKESQHRIGEPAYTDSLEHPADIDFDPESAEFYDDEASSAPGEYFIEGNGTGHMEFGGMLWKVLPYGKGVGDAGRSYYKYQLVNGGIKLFFRRDKHETVSNVWIEIGSIPLCLRGGLAAVRDELWGVFAKEGIHILKDIVSRIDIYSDFDVCDVEEFCRRFYENCKVTRARKLAKYGQDELNTALYMTGRKHTGFSIGTDIKLRCYDKRYELQRDPVKWGVFADKYDGIPEVLTRVEFQLRRTALKEFDCGDGKRIEGVDSYLAVRENLWRYLTVEWFRLTEEAVDRRNNHQSRAKTWAFWEAVQSAVVGVVECVRRLERKIKVDPTHLFKMGLGCICKASILELGGHVESPGEMLRYFREKTRSYGRAYYMEVMEKHYTDIFLRYGHSIA